MPDIQTCPHCREEFDDKDLKEFRLRLDFEKEYEEKLIKIRRLKKLFTSGWPVLLMFILAALLANGKYASWVLISLTFTLVSSVLYIPYASDKKESALFEQYKSKVNV